MFTIESDFNLAKFFKENDIAFNENFPSNEGCEHEYILHGHTACSVIFEIGNKFNANYLPIETGFAIKSKYTFEVFMEEVDDYLVKRIGFKSSVFKDNNWESDFDLGESSREAVESFLRESMETIEL